MRASAAPRGGGFVFGAAFAPRIRFWIIPRFGKPGPPGALRSYRSAQSQPLRSGPVAPET